MVDMLCDVWLRSMWVPTKVERALEGYRCEYKWLCGLRL